MLTDAQIEEIAKTHIARFGKDLSLSAPVVIGEPPGHFYKAIRPSTVRSTNLVSPFFVKREDGSITSISAGDVMPGIIVKLYGWETMRKDHELQMAVIDPDFSKKRHVEVWGDIIRECMTGKGA